jgi:pilus assembly protein CpaE
MQRIAIVDPSDLTREPLRNLLLGMESVWVDAEGARYEFFPDIVAQSHPDVAIVALDSDQGKALQLIQRLRAEIPQLPIIAVSARGDGQSILQALRAGAKEFLTQPVVLEELMTTLQNLRTSGDHDGPASGGSMVIAMIGSRGGAGATSLAVNLGCTLAQNKSHSVALIDLDLALGDADVALDLIPDHTLADVAMNIERLDMQFLRRALCKHKTGLALLSRPLRIEEIGLIHEEHLQRLIGLLRASFTHLILDLGQSFTGTDQTAIRLADLVFIVTQLEITSVRNTVRILHHMGEDGGMADKARVLLNRNGSDFWEGDIGQKKAEDTIGRPFFWKIPNDFKSMVGSRSMGIPLVQHAPKSKIQQAINQLASALSAEPAVAETPASTGSGWWRRGS